jgi:hypothetical protein
MGEPEFPRGVRIQRIDGGKGDEGVEEGQDM